MGVGKVWLHTVIDTVGYVAFGFLYTSKQPETAMALLHNEVLHFYAEREIPVTPLLTDNGREFCGTESHRFELYLALSDIEHRTTRVRRPQTNGFVEQFHRTVLDEFFRIASRAGRKAFRATLYESVEALEADLDGWPTFTTASARIRATVTVAIVR